MINNYFKNWYVFFLLIISIVQISGCKNQAESHAAEAAPAEAAPVEAAPLSEQEIAELEKEVMPEIPGGYKNKILNKNLFKKWETLGDVENYLDSILSIGGFQSNKRFVVKGGFGIASEVETIKANGDSESEPKRFDTEFDFSRGEGNWLQKFLYPRTACRTRMFVFIFSNIPFQNRMEDQLSLTKITEWTNLGLSSLPNALAHNLIDNSYDLNVLVYEYNVTDINSKGKLNKSGITVINHLKKAKLWHQEMGN